MHGVAHIAEAAGLFAIAVDADGSVIEGLADEIWKDHAVAAGLPRANGVEQADDDDGDFLFLPIREREKFVEGFGSGVAPAALGGGAEDKIGLLAKRNLGAFAVDLRGRSCENEFAFFCRGFQDVLRAVDVGLNRADGAFNDQTNADGGGEMDDDVGIVDELRNKPAIFDRV
jgi:hypothetical protein